MGGAADGLAFPVERSSGKTNVPTLADVARLAGVSVSTAGRVLRQQDWPVDQAMKERVLAAAAELSYVPNLMARTLRAGGPAMVGLVVGNMLDPYYGEIAEVVGCPIDTVKTRMFHARRRLKRLMSGGTADWL